MATRVFLHSTAALSQPSQTETASTATESTPPRHITTFGLINTVTTIHTRTPELTYTICFLPRLHTPVFRFSTAVLSQPAQTETPHSQRKQRQP